MGPVPTVDVRKAREYLHRRSEERRSQLQGRFAEANRDFDRIVEMLVRQKYATRIYQWGSLLDERHFSEISDIDVALEGCPSAERFFKAYGEAMAMTRFPLDMIELEKTEPVHAESIRKKGRLVYDAEAGTP